MAKFGLVKDLASDEGVNGLIQLAKCFLYVFACLSAAKKPV